MTVLVTVYVIHIGGVLSLSPVTPGREEAPVVTTSLIVTFLPVVKGQILRADWHSVQGYIIYEARVRKWKDSYNQYEHKQNIQLAISATQRGCSCLVITLHIFFTFLHCNSQGLVVCCGFFFFLKTTYFLGFSRERGTVEGGGDVKAEVGFSQKTVPYWK